MLYDPKDGDATGITDAVLQSPRHGTKWAPRQSGRQVPRYVRYILLLITSEGSLGSVQWDRLAVYFSDMLSFAGRNKVNPQRFSAILGVSLSRTLEGRTEQLSYFSSL